MRTVAAFVVGFVVGVLALGAGLWSSGGLRSSVVPPWIRAHLSRTLAPTPGTLPPPPADLTANAQIPAPPVPPPEPAPAAPAPNPSNPQGSAERVTPEPAAESGATRPATEPAATGQAPVMHLAMPIAGVDPKSLTDTFHQARNGHQHEAIDIPAPRNTPVLAVVEGNVAKLFNSKEGGLTVYQFDDTSQYAFYYAHLDHYANGLKEGTLLRRGDVLGYVGTTGDAPADAPHLHFTVFKLGPDHKWWQGTALDPLPMLK